MQLTLYNFKPETIFQKKGKDFNLKLHNISIK